MCIVTARDSLKTHVASETTQMGHAGHALIRSRRRHLIARYADTIRTALAYKLLYDHGSDSLTRDILDEHAKNVVILMLHKVDVKTHWPPDADTDAEIDSLLTSYLDKLKSQADARGQDSR